MSGWDNINLVALSLNPLFLLSFTEDIDKLLCNEVDDDFADMERLMGYSPPPDAADATAGTDAEKEEDKEGDEKEEEEAKDEEAEPEQQDVVQEEEEKVKDAKESLKDRARKNLSIFFGKFRL